MSTDRRMPPSYSRVLIVEASDDTYAILMRRVHLIMPTAHIERALTEEDGIAWRAKTRGLVVNAENISELNEAVSAARAFEVQTLHREISDVRRMGQVDAGLSAAVAMSIEQLERVVIGDHGENKGLVRRVDLIEMKIDVVCKHVEKIEGNLSKVVWLILSLVITAIMGLVLVKSWIGGSNGRQSFSDPPASDPPAQARRVDS